MVESTQWAHRLRVALTRTLISLKFQILTHPLGKNVEHYLEQTQRWIFWELMSLVWNSVVLATILLSMMVVHMVNYFLKRTYTQLIRKPLVYLLEIKQKLLFMVSYMAQEMKKLVKSWVKGKLKGQD